MSKKPSPKTKQPKRMHQVVSTNVLWTGAIIAPLVCAISLIDLVLDYEKLSMFSKAWAVFIIIFSGYYAYDFGRELVLRKRAK